MRGSTILYLPFTVIHDQYVVHQTSGPAKRTSSGPSRNAAVQTSSLDNLDRLSLLLPRSRCDQFGDAGGLVLLGHALLGSLAMSA